MAANAPPDNGNPQNAVTHWRFAVKLFAGGPRAPGSTRIEAYAKALLHAGKQPSDGGGRETTLYGLTALCVCKFLLPVPRALFRWLLVRMLEAARVDTAAMSGKTKKGEAAAPCVEGKLLALRDMVDCATAHKAYKAAGKGLHCAGDVVARAGAIASLACNAYAAVLLSCFEQVAMEEGGNVGITMGAVCSRQMLSRAQVHVRVCVRKGMGMRGRSCSHRSSGWLMVHG